MKPRRFRVDISPNGDTWITCRRSREPGTWVLELTDDDDQPQCRWMFYPEGMTKPPTLKDADNPLIC